MEHSRIPFSGTGVALTFDDGPHPENTPRLLDLLGERGARATFFVIGDRAEAHPEIVRRILDEGHELGNHTQTHPMLPPLSDGDLREELARCGEAIERAAGVPPKVMRPPYGALTRAQRDTIRAEFGYETILWSVDPLDWKCPGAGIVAERILDRTNPGSIILAHDIHAGTVDAMPIVLDVLLEKGFNFETVSRLLDRAAERGGVGHA